MRSIWRASVCVFVVLIEVHYPANGQENVAKYQIGVGVGTYVYMGDLTPDPLGSYRTLKPALSLFASRFLSRSLAVRLNVGFGKLIGDDAKYPYPDYRQQRNFKFSSPLLELSALAEWNILGRNYISRGIAPYAFAGMGYGFLKVRRDWTNFNTEYFGNEVINGLALDAQHRPPRGVLVLPVGFGARYYLTDKIGFSAEASYRIMSTDYLDGFSEAANPTQNDHYGIYSLGAVFRIGKKNTLACPVVTY